jgi:DNA repair exonuclease SbcCD nuclease subunit
MKVAIITDTHFGVRNESPIWMKAHSMMVQEFFQQVKDRDIHTIWMLGDIVDSRKSISSKMLSWIKTNWTQPIKDLDLEVHQILGNHDTFYRSTNLPNLPSEIFDHVNNIYIYENNPIRLKVGSKYVLMCPWICPENHQAVMEALAVPVDVVCGHFDIVGCLMHGTQVSDHGLSQELFSAHKKVFSGHYHKKSTAGHIHYLGNPVATNWSESIDPHGFHFYDVEEDHLEFAEFTYPLYNKVYVQGNDQADYTYVDNGACFIKVFVHKDRNEFYLQQLITQIRELNHVLQLQIIDDRQDASVSEVEFDEDELRTDLLGLMHRTVNESDYPDPKQMIQLLTELHNQCKQASILG